MRIFIISLSHPENDKRVVRTVKMLGKFGDVFYQFSGKCHEDHENWKICIPYPKKSYEPLSWFLKWRKFEMKILNAAERVKPDVTYVHGFPYFFKRFPDVLRNLSKRVVYDLHENYPYQFMSKSRFHRYLRRSAVKMLDRIFSNTDALVFVSSESAAVMMTLVEKVKPYFIMPNLPLYCKGTMLYENREKSVVVLGKSSRSEEKFISVYKIFNQRGYEIKIIGRDMTLEGVRARSLGFLKYEDMMNELSKSFAVLIPFGDHEIGNLISSFPNRFFDSLGAGTPVMVDYRNLTMAKYTLENGVGIVVDLEDPKNLIEKLSYLEENYPKILENTKRVQCWEDVLENYEKFLERIIHER